MIFGPDDEMAAADRAWRQRPRSVRREERRLRLRALRAERRTAVLADDPDLERIAHLTAVIRGLERVVRE